MANLFAKAKDTSVKTSAKKNDKLTVIIKDDEFDKSLRKIVELTAQMDLMEAELSMAQGYVKEVGKDMFYDVYSKNGSYPGSFIMATPSDASIMFIPTDKYIKCDMIRANELKDSYGDDIITEKTEFVFNADLLEKYGEIISDLIQNSPDIDVNDKDLLIKANTTISVSKGSIEKALTWGKGKISDFMRDIQPVFTLKSAKAK